MNIFGLAAACPDTQILSDYAIQCCGLHPLGDVAQKPIPCQASGRRWSINSHIEMVSLGKNPCVSAGDSGKIKCQIDLSSWHRGFDLERKALRKPGARRTQAPYLATGPIGANQKSGPISFAVRDQLHCILAERNLLQGANPAETGARLDRLAQAIFIELRPNRHHADG